MTLERRRIEPRAIERIRGYKVRYSARAKRLQVRVRAWLGVEIVAPRRCSVKKIERFIRTHQEWIERASRRLPAAPPTESLPATIRLPALAAMYRVQYAGAPGARVREMADQLCVPATPDEPVEARRQLRLWLAAKTRAALVPRLDTLAARYGFTYNKVSIRGQRTRWGSCSAQKNLNINYKLLFVEPELVDYLFVHELAHTRHLNHSARFWRLVSDCLPNYQQLEARMKQTWRAVPGWVEAP